MAYVREGAALKRGLKELGKTQRWLKERLDRKRQGELSVCQNTIWGYCNNRNMPIETWEEIRTHIFSPERKRQRQETERRRNNQKASINKRASDKKNRELESERRREEIRGMLYLYDGRMRELAETINRPYNTVKGWLSGKKMISDEAYRIMQQANEDRFMQYMQEQYRNVAERNKNYKEKGYALIILLDPDARARIEQEATARNIGVSQYAEIILNACLKEPRMPGLHYHSV